MWRYETPYYDYYGSDWRERAKDVDAWNLTFPNWLKYRKFILGSFKRRRTSQDSIAGIVDYVDAELFDKPEFIIDL